MNGMPISHIMLIVWSAIGDIATVLFHISLTIAAIVYIKNSIKHKQ